MKTENKAESLSLTDTVAMGTGVMIGAGIFALTGQVAELAGDLFPLAFLAGAAVTGFSAYSYVKVSNAYPSSGGIAMILHKAYGHGTVTGACAILMALSMVINESLVARTFGTYTLQIFDIEGGFLVPVLGVGLIIFAFLINVSGNRAVGTAEQIMALIKILGIALFGVASIWIAGDLSALPAPDASRDSPVVGFLAALALTVLAFKGFTTITNSGGEIVDPHRNVGRAIVISILVCLVVYMLVALGVAANLSLPEIIKAKDFALAQASRPALGDFGLWFTVVLAIVATASGLIASIFAVSRMLTMLTEMSLIPHSHFGMKGPLQRHLLVYTVVIAIILTVFFDLSRIAALGAIFYLIMDMGIHWGVLRHLREDVNANPVVLVTAIILDLVVLAAFVAIKVEQDVLIVWVAVAGLVAVFGGEWLYLRIRPESESESGPDS